MPANRQTRFDSGPLSWVRAEIEHSLASARTHLDELGADPRDATALQSAASCLHQVTGALSMVSLGAAARLSEEIEKLVAAFAVAIPADAAQQLVVAKSSMLSLSSYLDGLLAGAPDRPMSLVTKYMTLNRVRGANDASPGDLFSPDLSATVPLPDDVSAPLSAEQLAEAVRQQRSLFQAGLLKLLRDKDLVNGARLMRDAVQAIEALLFSPLARSFWFTASGFFEAVANDPAGAGAPAVQLFGKIDQQIKLLIGGNGNVPEALFRDLLFVVGKSAARSERIDEIRDVYRLDELLATPDAGLHPQAEPALVALVGTLAEQVQKLKANLLAFDGRDSAALEAFASQAERLADMGQQLSNAELAQLLRVLGAIGRHVRKTGRPLNAVQALEVASAMLFIESSLENYFKLAPEFAKQASSISARLRSAMTGIELPPSDLSANSLGDTMTLRAQTHLLIFQVGREVQINLNTIEAALDAFFRDPLKIAGLAPVGPLLKQVQGALSMLELDEAAALSEAVSRRVAQFVSGAVEGNGDAANAVADGVSALGIYVNGLQQNAADPRALLLPALIRFGLAETPAKVRKGSVKARAAAPHAERAAPATEGRAGAAPAAANQPPAAASAPPLQLVINAPKPAPKPAPEPVTNLGSPVPGEGAASTAHRDLHMALDLALGGKAESVPAAPPASVGERAIVAPAAPAPAGMQDELQRLKQSELELRVIILARDQRIKALELLVANLNANAHKAAAG